MKYTKFSFVSAALLLVLPLTTLNASGQVQTVQLAPNHLATNIAGVTTSIAPPEGFNPIEASAADLAKYGFPPRPDQSLAPKQFASWSKAMAASQTRVFASLEKTDLVHGPKRAAVPAKNVQAEGVENTSYSSNWSGQVMLSGATSYNSTSTFYEVLADYVVPTAEIAFSGPSTYWRYSSSWVGIDGWNSGDVLQTGTESDAYCNSSNNAISYNIDSASCAYYSAWVEWYPNGSYRINNVSFPVAAGDDIYVFVWHTSATVGFVYVLNYNNNQSVEYELTAPSGSSLIGNSAECIVERPGISGGLATLTNYVSDYFSDCYAYTENFTFYDAAAALSVDMLDNSGYVISYPTLLGPYGIWFQDENSARSASAP